MVTTIQVEENTKETLSKLKGSKNETYDEIIKKLLDLIPQGDEEGEYTDAFRAGILHAMLDLKQGKTISHSEVKKSFGLQK